jgi:hypothetical protein
MGVLASQEEPEGVVLGIDPPEPEDGEGSVAVLAPTWISTQNTIFRLVRARKNPDGRPGRGRPRRRPVRLVADKGYSYPTVRAELRRRGSAAVIPTRAD